MLIATFKIIILGVNHFMNNYSNIPCNYIFNPFGHITYKLEKFTVKEEIKTKQEIQRNQEIQTVPLKSSSFLEKEQEISITVFVNNCINLVIDIFCSYDDIFNPFGRRFEKPKEIQTNQEIQTDK
jgi:hypothetical protein